MLGHVDADTGSRGELLHRALERRHLGLEKLDALRAAEELQSVVGLLVAEDHL